MRHKMHKKNSFLDKWGLQWLQLKQNLNKQYWRQITSLHKIIAVNQSAEQPKNSLKKLDSRLYKVEIIEMWLIHLRPFLHGTNVIIPTLIKEPRLFQKIRTYIHFNKSIFIALLNCLHTSDITLWWWQPQQTNHNLSAGIATESISPHTYEGIIT